MKVTGRSTTEVSGITAIVLGVNMLASGAIVPGTVAFGIGALLMVAYEYFGIEGIELDGEQIRWIGERAEDEVDEYQ